jgi:hypothetical protein
MKSSAQAKRAGGENDCLCFCFSLSRVRPTRKVESRQNSKEEENNDLSKKEKLLALFFLESKSCWPRARWVRDVMLFLR